MTTDNPMQRRTEVTVHHRRQYQTMHLHYRSVWLVESKSHHRYVRHVAKSKH